MDKLKKISNTADWAMKQTDEIVREIGMIYDLKGGGHIDTTSSSASYARPICRDICDRMHSLLRTIMNLGMMSINYGPFLRAMDAYNAAEHFLNDELLCDTGLFVGRITSSRLEKIYDEANKIFRNIRTCINDMVDDAKEELEDE